MIPRLKADLGLKDILAAMSIWQRCSVERFEYRFAKLMSQQYALAFPYGRTGLVALLKALDLHGSDIICPAYTCVVVQHAIITAGYNPVLVDSQPEDFNMDWQYIEQATTENTSALIVTSIFGLPVDLDALDNYRKHHPNVRIIQDCAHSYAAEWKGRPVQREGDAAFYGLNISKIITSVYGGMVTTDKFEIYQSIRKVRGEMLVAASMRKSIKRLFYLLAIIPAFWRPIYGIVNRIERIGLIDKFVKYFDESIIDMPSDYLEQITELEARVGLVQCESYHKIVAHRQKIANVYFKALKNKENLILPPEIDGATYSHFVIRTPVANKKKAEALLLGIQLGELIDYDVSEMKCYRNYPYFGKKTAKLWPEQVINLPVHTGISESDAVRIAALFE